jgi:class 3 adenylate cyclase
MAQPTLKSLLGKRSELAAWLQTWVTQTNLSIGIQDHQNNLVFGSRAPGAEPTAIYLDNDVAGYVYGDDQSSSVSRLLTVMLQKESEKKKLGAEVLSLYQELNVIYNFSEKLSETIDPDTIAAFTLEQAIHSIPTNSGVIVLWDEWQHHLTIPASLGEPLFNAEQLRRHSNLLLKIGLSGQSEIISDVSFLKSEGIIRDEVRSLVYAAMKVKHRIMGAIILAGKTDDQFSAGALKLLITLALQSSTAIESAMLYEKNIREAREREEAILRIHEVTKKFVPSEFIRALGREELTDIRLGDQAEKIVTVLFTDIRDFTTLSEQMTPEENFRFVSSFNARLGPIIRAHNGFINQYLGDSIMAIFPETADDAMLAGIAMQQSVAGLNLERQQLGLPAIHAGIGMHTGPLIMGITGDEYRLDAATISDTVNTASRLESLTKHYHAPLLLSQETYNQLSQPQRFHLRRLGSVRLKGKRNILHVIECFDGMEPTVFAKKKSTISDFDLALSLYHQRHFEKAIEIFAGIIAVHPDDVTVSYFLNNAIRYKEQGVSDYWTGSEEMAYK